MTRRLRRRSDGPGATETQAFEHGHAKQDDLVFYSLTGSPLAHHNIGRRGLEKALEAAGLPHPRWHDLRHVCASVMIPQGASVAYLSRLLGHANASVREREEHAANTREQMEAGVRRAAQANDERRQRRRRAPEATRQNT